MIGYTMSKMDGTPITDDNVEVGEMVELEFGGLGRIYWVTSIEGGYINLSDMPPEATAALARAFDSIDYRSSRTWFDD